MRGAAVVMLVSAAAGLRPADLATVETREAAPKYTAYAAVEPITTIVVSSVVAGAVEGFTAVPGASLRAGATVAKIAGPEQVAEIEGARSAVARSDAAVRLAESTAESVRSTYPDLTTRQQLDNARAAVAEARAALGKARAELSNQETAATVRAPAAGTVLETFVANGDRVAAGSPLLRLQPSGGLWVRGSFYGADAGAVSVGMKGRFEPADGSPPVPVQVRSVLAPLQRDGGRGVGCEATGGPALESGEMGTLELSGPRRAWAAVPSPALIMDGGRWWVLVEGGDGPQRRAVEVGRSMDGWTLIENGLTPGERVVVTDAYLIFHREFGKHYQPPD